MDNSPWGITPGICNILRRIIYMIRIKRNAIRCLKCGDIIESKSVHDFVTCSCGACSVDGGYDYLRRCGFPEDWESCSETYEDGDNNTNGVNE